MEDLATLRQRSQHSLEKWLLTAADAVPGADRRFFQESNADALEEKLKAKGFDTYMVQSGGFYKVQVGAYSIMANAETMMEKVKAAGLSDAFITTASGSAVFS